MWYGDRPYCKDCFCRMHFKIKAFCYPCCNCCCCCFKHLKMKAFGISCIFVICELGLMAGLCCSRYFSQISPNNPRNYLSKLILPAGSLLGALVINLLFEGFFWIIWCCFNCGKMEHPLFSGFPEGLQSQIKLNPSTPNLRSTGSEHTELI